MNRKDKIKTALLCLPSVFLGFIGLVAIAGSDAPKSSPNEISAVMEEANVVIEPVVDLEESDPEIESGIETEVQPNTQLDQQQIEETIASDYIEPDPESIYEPSLAITQEDQQEGHETDNEIDNMALYLAALEITLTDSYGSNHSIQYDHGDMVSSICC